MISAFIRFFRGLLRMPLYAQGWLFVLIALNGLVPLFFLEHIEARLVLFVFLADTVLMILITWKTGFSRLLGGGHFFWFPLLFWLVLRLGAFPGNETMGVWIRALMVTNAISLVIDTTDVIKWLRGDKEEMVDLT